MKKRFKRLTGYPVFEMFYAVLLIGIPLILVLLFSLRSMVRSMLEH